MGRGGLKLGEAKSGGPGNKASRSRVESCFGTRTSGAQPPVASLHYRISDELPQEPTGRERRCLLKGCERWYRPRCPQVRYCSAACREEAERWRRWRGSQRYRASDGGKARRREQSRRYRQRRRPSSALGEARGEALADAAQASRLGGVDMVADAGKSGDDRPPAVPRGGRSERDEAGTAAKKDGAMAAESGAEQSGPAERTADEAASATLAMLEREGQRPAEFFGGGEGRPCDRPGCYCLFVPKRCALGQRFCSLECRRALRRVLDREARWRQRWQQRRRRGWRERWGLVRPP